MLAQSTTTGGSPPDLARNYLGRQDLDGPWFQLGGSSLDAAKLISHLDREHGLSASLRDLLNAPSVAAFLDQLSGVNPIPDQPGRAVDSTGQAASVRAVTGNPADAEDRRWERIAVLWPALVGLSPREKLELTQRLVANAAVEFAE